MRNEKSELGPALLKHAERLRSIAVRVDIAANAIITELEKTSLLKDHVIEAHFMTDGDSMFVIEAYDVDEDVYKNTKEQIWDAINKIEELELCNPNEFTFVASVTRHDDTVKYYPDKV